MKRRAFLAFARLGMAVRGLWPDNNPVRRTADRAEAAVAMGMLAVFLMGGPLLGLAVRDWAYGAGQRTAAAQRAWHQVSAVLLRSAPAVGNGGYTFSVPARWSGPGRAQRTGEITVPAGARAGTSMTVWVDGGGRLTGPPLREAEIAAEAFLAALFAPAGLGVALLSGWGVAHLLLNRRRLAGWESEWRTTGPQWSRRR